MGTARSLCPPPVIHSLLALQLLFDVSEVVPELEGADAAEFAPRNDRLDGQRIVLGQRTCDLLAHGRLFMIGARLCRHALRVP